MSLPTSARTVPGGAAALRRFDPSALGALFWLTLRQQARGRRLIVLAVMFALPAALAVLLRSLSDGVTSGMLEAQLIFGVIPQALAPLAALLYATGVIQDEIEEQTLTYLLIRPLPRAALYVTKLLAAMLTTSLLAAAGTTVVYIAVYWGKPELWGEVLPVWAGKAAALFALAQVAYCAIFSFISLLTRRSLLAGIAYIVVIEGLLANWPFILRELTVMYYFRVLVLRALNPPHTEGWGIDLADAPRMITCMLILLGTGVVLTVLGGLTFARREFGVKTPEAA
jgi:ABC-2 type transport system permease protein